MGIKRGPDGVPIDMPSVKHGSEPDTQVERPTDKTTAPSAPLNFDDPPTVATGGTSAPQTNKSGLIFDDPPTAPANKPASTEPLQNTGSDVPEDLPTVVGRVAQPASRAEAVTHSQDQSAVIDPMSDPLSGWLVVVSGPGKGNAVRLGYGQNSIGRTPGERVCLNFGDSQISRSNHVTISYDPRGNQFYIQPGSGTNMTYLEGQPTPLLQPAILEPFSHISIGETTLRFVPLCGESFTWESVQEA